MNEFVILGAHRTGTTLLKFILESHPDCYVYGENSAYKAILGNVDYNFNKKSLVGYQLSGMIESLSLVSCKKYPILFTSRDVVDVVSSQRLLKLGRDSFLRGYIIPWYENRILCDEWFTIIMEKEINIISNIVHKTPEYKTLYSIGISALHYKWTQYLKTQYIKNGYKLLEVKYDQLINGKNLVDIQNFLNLPINNALFEHHTLPLENRSDLINNNEALGENYCDIERHNKSLGKGYRNLLPEEIDFIFQIQDI